MQDVYVIRNQLGHYWGKSKAWVDGRDARGVLRVKFRDEGVNLLFELSAKDIELRGEVLEVSLSERGEPLLEISNIPVPVADAAGNTEAGAEVKASDSTTHAE